MSDPEVKSRHRLRRRNKYARDLQSPKYRTRIISPRNTTGKRPVKDPPEMEEWDSLMEDLSE